MCSRLWYVVPPNLPYDTEPKQSRAAPAVSQGRLGITCWGAQWLGIVCIPAGYIHLSDALLTYSDVQDRRRRWLVFASYGLSAGFFALALSGNLLLHGGIASGPLAQLGAGPLFWLFALYFALTSLAGLLAIWQVRRSALTPNMRRRPTYLGATFLAPGLAVFPYLVIAGAYAFTPLSTACLRHCQSPLGFFMTHWRDGAVGALRMGMRHGLYCVGCCWALMAILFAVGVMNLAWVALLTLLVLLQKVSASSAWIARVAGAVLALAGLAMIVNPA